MPRPKNLIPSVVFNIALPLPVATKLNAYLYSDLESRIPHGAYQRFFTERLNEFFDHRELDLSPYLSEVVPTGTLIVRGSPETLAALTTRLKGAPE